MSSINPHSFTILGANVGTDQRDYTFLLKLPERNEADTIASCFAQYKSYTPYRELGILERECEIAGQLLDRANAELEAATGEKNSAVRISDGGKYNKNGVKKATKAHELAVAKQDAAQARFKEVEGRLENARSSLNPNLSEEEVKAASGAEEKLFAKLESNLMYQDFEEVKELLNDQTFVSLMLEKGLDIIESNLNDKYNPENAFKNLLDANAAQISTLLRARIKDKKGVDLFKQHYPALTTYCETNAYENKPLMPTFRASLWQTIKGIFSRGLPAIATPKVGSALENQLQSIKDRLAENFYRRVVASDRRPAVISLQEVYNNRNIVDIMTEAGYTVCRASDESDTVIAFDPEIFDLNEAFTVENEIGVVATNKKTEEKFIFVSVHVPGFSLESTEELDVIHAGLQGVVQYRHPLGMAVFERLKGEHQGAKVIVQGDFNVYPEFIQEAISTQPEDPKDLASLNIFEKFTKGGGEVVRGHAPTELNPHSENNKLRELDFAFTIRLNGRVRVIEPDDEELTTVRIDEGTQADEAGPHFDPKVLSSDHKPMFYTIDGPEPVDDREATADDL